MNTVHLFEASGIIRDAFADRGHHSISVDLRETERSGHHRVMDVWDFIETDEFQAADLVFLHYTCTFLAGSGLHWNRRIPGRADKTKQALDDVRRLIAALGRKRFCFENPSGAIGTNIRKSFCTVQPFWFGDDASKLTCLWLNGLMPLRIPPKCDWHPGRQVEWPKSSGKIVTRYSNQTDSGQNKEPPSEDRWAIRSQSFPGLSRAYAENWG